jgi:hypothetical protein
MRKFVMFAAAVLVTVSPAMAAETWTGTISDTKCAAKHDKSEHGGATADDHQCVNECVEGGEKYVFLSGGKTYHIANQDFAALKNHAGHNVALSGDMKGDSITITKIEMPKAAKK